MTPEFSPEIAAELVAHLRDDSFDGRFFYDGERGDIGYVPKACDEKQCDCERKLNADGDQDCSHSLSDWEGEDHLCEPIVNILNRTRAVADMLEAACAEVERLRGAWDEGVSELTKSSYAQVSLVTNRLHETEADRDSLRASCEQLTRERDELKAEVERLLAGKGTP